MVKEWVPEAGEVIWVDFNPTVGHEQAGHRPALVISPSNYNARGSMCIACPLTKEVKGWPFEVTMPDGYVVLADQVRSIDWRMRNARSKEVAPVEVLAQVRVLLRTLMQIS